MFNEIINIEDSCIGNFSLDEEELYGKAIELYEREYPEEKGSIYIENDAFDCQGAALPNDKSLHRKKTSTHIPDFWRIFRTLKQEEDMKKTGIIRRVDDLGRIVIPREIRRLARIQEGDPLEICFENKTICLQKYSTTTELEELLSELSEQVMAVKLDKIQFGRIIECLGYIREYLESVSEDENK